MYYTCSATLNFLPHLNLANLVEVTFQFLLTVSVLLDLHSLILSFHLLYFMFLPFEK